MLNQVDVNEEAQVLILQYYDNIKDVLEVGSGLISGWDFLMSTKFVAGWVKDIDENQNFKPTKMDLSLLLGEQLLGRRIFQDEEEALKFFGRDDLRKWYFPAVVPEFLGGGIFFLGMLDGSPIIYDQYCCCDDCSGYEYQD